MRIGIIGAGLSGLALAQRLSARGHQVTVIERDQQPGGLATWEDHGSFVFDRYYHVILPSDRYLISFLRDIGLEDQLRWETTLTGFFVDREMHSMSNALEFLRFPALSLWGKFRLASTILYCSRINNWQRLENTTVEDFLIRHSGRKTYLKLWKPLLLAKLGENYKRVSAVFIWTYIKRMFSARDSSASKEQMGHVYGGYRTVFQRLIEVINTHGGEVRLNCAVERISAAGSGDGIEVTCNGSAEHFDKVIFTGPTNILKDVADDGLVAVDDSGKDVEYLGVLCMALVTKSPLTNFYILNIADERIPFTGVVGMSNILDPGETAGQYLTYLPKYVLSTDAELRRPEEDLRAEFLDGLRIMFPELKDDDIVSARIHRAFKVQPLQVLNFSRLSPKTETRNDDFFVHNTAQFVNNTLNNNEVIRAVDAFMATHGDQLGDVRETIGSRSSGKPAAEAGDVAR
jgi:protoporphyrinogen oxidase